MSNIGNKQLLSATSFELYLADAGSGLLCQTSQFKQLWFYLCWWKHCGWLWFELSLCLQTGCHLSINEILSVSQHFLETQRVSNYGSGWRKAIVSQGWSLSWTTLLCARLPKMRKWKSLLLRIQIYWRFSESSFCSFSLLCSSNIKWHITLMVTCLWFDELHFTLMWLLSLIGYSVSSVQNWNVTVQSCKHKSSAYIKAEIQFSSKFNYKNVTFRMTITVCYTYQRNKK